jgi:hypothetical protein
MNLVFKKVNLKKGSQFFNHSPEMRNACNFLP